MNMLRYLIIFIFMAGNGFNAKACQCLFIPGDSTFFTSMNMSYNTTSFYVLKGYKTHFVQGGVGYKVIDKVYASHPIPDTIMIFGDLTGMSCFTTPMGGIGDTTYIFLSRQITASGAPQYPQVDSGDFTAWLCSHHTLMYGFDSVYTFGPNFPIHQAIRMSEQQFLDSIRVLALPTSNVIKDEGSVAIYPNPASQLLYIKPEQGILIEQAKLYNTMGQGFVVNLFNNQIDISHLANGIYFLYLHTNKGILPRKIIINH